jgi:hypothetical protein
MKTLVAVVIPALAAGVAGAGTTPKLLLPVSTPERCEIYTRRSMSAEPHLGGRRGARRSLHPTPRELDEDGISTGWRH